MSSRAKGDAEPSPETVSAPGVRQRQAQRDGGFLRANPGAKSLDPIPDRFCEPLLDLVIKSLRQKGSELVKRALDKSYRSDMAEMERDRLAL